MSTSSQSRHVVIVGGGVTGLTCAYRLLTEHESPGRTPVDVTVIEADGVLGGKIRTSEFAGVAVEEGPDAYLARVPHAVALARELGFDNEITHPASGHAAVWHNGLHRIPQGLLLGVPSGSMALARSSLLSVRGKLRAALEPILPDSGDPGDSIGVFVRRRFGREVQERLVDPLVGSIYAADTMNFSLGMVPQLADLTGHRSVLLSARKRLASAPPSTEPVFDAPRRGLSSLIGALQTKIGAHSGNIVTGTRVESIERNPGGPSRYVLRTSGDHSTDILADAVIVCSPARASARMMRSLDDSIASAFASWTHASVVIVTVQVTSPHLSRFDGLSGYLVPKPDQDRVTAVSFGSNKWAHWRPSDGSMILRVSLGRDGMRTDDLVSEWDDSRLLRQAMDEVSGHMGTDLTPGAVRVTRWPESFPQYRPGHAARVADIEKRLAAVAPGVFLAGASWHGIGIPACVGDANHIAGVTGHFLAEM